MIALQIENTGSFMSKLLRSECFDLFLLEEAVIRKAATWKIDGHMNRAFLAAQREAEGKPAEADDPDMIPWSEVRPWCFDLIKGKTAPTLMRFTLRLSPEEAEAVFTPENAAAQEGEQAVSFDYLINVTYEKAVLKIVTGIAMNGFSMDLSLRKDADRRWDDFIREMMEANMIRFQELT